MAGLITKQTSPRYSTLGPAKKELKLIALGAASHPRHTHLVEEKIKEDAMIACFLDGYGRWMSMHDRLGKRPLLHRSVGTRA